MVDSLAFPAAAPFVTPTAPAATAAPVVEFASPPPPSLLAAGGVIAATVVSSVAMPGAPAAGSELMLRVALGALPSSPATLTATVVQSGGPTTLVDSKLGRLALQAQIDLTAGSTLTLERLASPARAGTAAAPTSPTLGSGWPALDDALAALERTAPDLATQLRA